MLEPSILVSFAISKGRNIVYYRKIDDRPRAQYIHVLRKYRQDLRELSLQLKDNPEYTWATELFGKLVKAIPPKVKSDECTEVIEVLGKILEPYVK